MDSSTKLSNSLSGLVALWLIGMFLLTAVGKVTDLPAMVAGVGPTLITGLIALHVATPKPAN